MTVEPPCASTERDSPDASTNMIFGIEQSNSLGYRVTPQGRVNIAGERRLYRAPLDRASAEGPKEHSEHLALGVIREHGRKSNSAPSIFPTSRGCVRSPQALRQPRTEALRSQPPPPNSCRQSLRPTPRCATRRSRRGERRRRAPSHGVCARFSPLIRGIRAANRRAEPSTRALAAGTGQAAPLEAHGPQDIGWPNERDR
jgi:hypothetical protein